MQHTLKTWPEPFEALQAGRKLHEIRKDDRNFRVGDELLLQEFKPCPKCNGTNSIPSNGDTDPCGCPAPHGFYTGRQLVATITYKTPGGAWGLPEQLCVLSIRVTRVRS